MTATTRQLPLPLHWKAARGKKDFFVSDANREAVRFLDGWSLWPIPVGLLIGPPASGKSHLADIFCRRAGARLIDNADYLRDEEELFHAWNGAIESRRPLLLTARSAPADWGLRLADLRSRLASTPRARIGRPDDALLEAVFTKLWRDRGVAPAPAFTRYVVARIERSFSSVERAVRRLDHAALARKQPPTIPLARAVLGRAGA